MVYRGRPSRDCLPCRKRKLRCDLQNAGCGQCRRAKIVCHGYRNLGDMVFIDQTADTAAKNKSLACSSSAEDDEQQMLKPFQTLRLHIDDLAQHEFFENYVCGLAKTYDSLSILYRVPQPGEHLVASVNAVSLMFFARRLSYPPRNILFVARQRYIEALRLVNLALGEPKSSIADETLQSILLLDVYDKLSESGSAKMGSNMVHLNGALSLIEARGNRNLQTYVGIRLTRRLCAILVIACAVTGSRVPARLEQLVHCPKLSEHGRADPKWLVVRLNCKVINLAADLREGRLTNPDVAVLESLQLDRGFHELERTLQPRWRGCKSSLAEREGLAQLCWGEYYDVYGDFFHSQVRNVIRVIRLGLQRIITELGRGSVCQRSRHVEALAAGICKSATEYVLPEKGSDGRQGFTPMQQVRCQTLLFPLYLAATTTTNPSLRHWVMAVLQHMAEVGGVRPARMVSDVLRKPDCHVWDVYSGLGAYVLAA